MSFHHKTTIGQARGSGRGFGTGKFLGKCPQTAGFLCGGGGAWGGWVLKCTRHSLRVLKQNLDPTHCPAGKQLLIDAGKRTGSHSFVPWVIVDGKQVDSDLFLQAVCAAYAGPLLFSPPYNVSLLSGRHSLYTKKGKRRGEGLKKIHQSGLLLIFFAENPEKLLVPFWNSTSWWTQNCNTHGIMLFNHSHHKPPLWIS